MKKNPKKILIGSAWPYANGPLHLGHVAALLPADVIARYHRLAGNRVLFVSGSDCHGTPIALAAEKENRAPREIAENYHQDFKKNFQDLGFSYDIYTKTTTENHRKVVQKIFIELFKKGYIYSKKERLPFCPRCKRFLPDRYIEGACPLCGFLNARGDQCDDCGGLINALEIINPKCKICGVTPVPRETEHFFLKLSMFQSKLRKWIIGQKHWRRNARNFTLSFLKQGLHDRAITRDIKWGVRVPIKGYESKRIYVWMEAVLGYLSASIEYANKKKISWKDFWGKKDTYFYLVFGKDNIPFHTIILPSMLLGLENGFHLPDQMIASEFLTLEGKQFSTSRNWAVWLSDYLLEFEPDPLRFYLIYGGPEKSDSDFSWKCFVEITNATLVANYGNLVHRVLSFIQANCHSVIPKPQNINPEDKFLLDETKSLFNKVGELTAAGELQKAITEIIKLSKRGNRYFDKLAPWKDKKNQSVLNGLYVSSQLIFGLGILFFPFLPFSSKRIFRSFGIKTEDIKWGVLPDIGGKRIKTPEILFRKILPEEVKREVVRLKKKHHEVKRHPSK